MMHRGLTDYEPKNVSQFVSSWFFFGTISICNIVYSHVKFGKLEPPNTINAGCK